jgi:ApaG protein
MFVCTTNGITVRVETEYLPSHSDVRRDLYTFGYHIAIENNSPYTVQLLRRRWSIKAATGAVRIVEGEGVIGLQPILEPGETHAYASFCDLHTEIGTMHGHYTMARRDDGSLFEVLVPLFFMCTPAKLN